MTSASYRLSSVERISPTVQRIWFVGPPLSWVDHADESVGIFFPNEPDEGRNYTIRARRDSRVAVDFVEHPTGIAVSWLRRARLGDLITMTAPRGWYRPPRKHSRQILVSDMSGLPALARIVDELDDAAEVLTVVELADARDAVCIPDRGRGGIELAGTGNWFGASRLLSALKEVDLRGDDYLWFAGECEQVRHVRKFLRALGWTQDRSDLVGYWRRADPRWERRFARHEAKLAALYNEQLSAGVSEKEASERYDDALEALGL